MSSWIHSICTKSLANWIPSQLKDLFKKYIILLFQLSGWFLLIDHPSVDDKLL